MEQNSLDSNEKHTKPPRNFELLEKMTFEELEEMTIEELEKVISILEIEIVNDESITQDELNRQTIQIGRLMKRLAELKRESMDEDESGLLDHTDLK